MKKVLRLSAFIPFSLLFIACDPPHNIDFINKTDNNVEIRIKLNPKVPNEAFYDFNNDLAVYSLKPKDTAQIAFGIGTWSDSEIEHVTQTIESIEIETQNIKTTYKSKAIITKMLKDNLKELFFQTDIEIEVE